MIDTAAWYRWFADHEASGSSPTYEVLARHVATSAALIDGLDVLPAAKRQPNLLFAAVRLLGGSTDNAADFERYVLANHGEVTATMSARSTQTNEVARCAGFLPVLSALKGEIALIEIGASAGLCLLPDRYGYSYDGEAVGSSTLVIEARTNGAVPVPTRMPDVVWRAGLDLNPLDVADADDLAWLRACVWPEHETRRRRLDRAAAIVAADPPRIDRGDLLESTLALIDEAPSSATKVVFHSAVLAYVDEPGRSAFTDTMIETIRRRDDVLWLSNEAPGVASTLQPVPIEAERMSFVLGRNGVDVLARTDPHGSWIDWLV